MQACNQCHAVHINETAKYLFFFNFSRALFFSTIFHNRQITSYYYFPLKKKTLKKKMKENRLGQVKNP